MVGSDPHMQGRLATSPGKRLSAPVRRPLSAHFSDDGIPATPLTVLQREARDDILSKLERGAYRLEIVPCPLCFSANARLISEKDASGLPIASSLCLDCGVLYASRRLDEASLASFYEHENLKLDRGIESAEAILFRNEQDQGAHIAKFLRENGILESLRDSLVVEIGCGPGGILAHFQELGFEVAGFDIDPAVVAFGRQKGVAVHLGNVNSAREVLRNLGCRIGLVIYSQSLEHMADPRTELRMARALMDSRTYLFVGVPGIRNIGPHYRYDLLNYLQPGHLIHFERRSLNRLLSESGFDEIASNERIDAIFRLGVATGQIPEGNLADGMLDFLSFVEKKRARKAAARRIRNTIGKLIRPVLGSFRGNA
jgi:SAM-dependent methyltransferase